MEQTPTTSSLRAEDGKPKRRPRQEPVLTDEGIHIRLGANLPHWTREGATYAVTFRLADSLPKEAVARFAREREQARDMKEERERWAKLQEIAAREEDELARGAGSCLLRRPGANAVVANALRYFDGTRYALFAYVIMPNHVPRYAPTGGNLLGERNPSLLEVIHGQKVSGSHR